jgi:signal transduction histidine kinase
MTLLAPVQGRTSAILRRRELGLFLGVALITLVLGLAPPSEKRTLVDQCVMILFSSVSAGLCGVRAIRGAGAERAGWWSLTLGMALQCTSHVIGLAILTHRLEDGPVPNLMYWLQVSVLPCIAGCLELWPLGRMGRASARRALLDSLLFGVALFFLFWQIGLRDYWRFAGPGRWASAAIVAGFLASAALFSFWVYRTHGANRVPSGPVAWIGLFCFLGALNNVLTFAALLKGTYGDGSWLHWLILLTLAIPGFAAIDEREIRGLETRTDRFAARSKFWTLLPYTPIIASLVLMFWQVSTLRGALDWRAMLLVSLVVVLLLWRQYLSMEDLQRFSLRLESKVKERTESLEKAQALLLSTERLNTMATLGAGMAHDLKNHMGIVRNFAILVATEVAEGRPVDPEDLACIQKAADEAGKMAQQLMAFGREEAESSDFELNQRVGALVDTFRAALPPVITLQVETAATPLFLHGDPSCIDHILANLIFNARDAIPNRGTIRILLWGERSGDGSPSACIRVEDNGLGMSRETLGRIGEPFFTTKAPGEGTGLGLASVKALVGEMAGDFSVESRLGSGTVFTLRFRVVEAG